MLIFYHIVLRHWYSLVWIDFLLFFALACICFVVCILSLLAFSSSLLPSALFTRRFWFRMNPLLKLQHPYHACFLNLATGVNMPLSSSGGTSSLLRTYLLLYDREISSLWLPHDCSFSKCLVASTSQSLRIIESFFPVECVWFVTFTYQCWHLNDFFPLLLEPLSLNCFKSTFHFRSFLPFSLNTRFLPLSLSCFNLSWNPLSPFFFFLKFAYSFSFFFLSSYLLLYCSESFNLLLSSFCISFLASLHLT